MSSPDSDYNSGAEQNGLGGLVYDEEAEQKRSVGSNNSHRNKDRRSRSRPPPLERQDTFTIDDGDNVVKNWRHRSQKGHGNKDLLDSTLHTGGIRAILEKANAEFVFPTEVKNYIRSHFDMIKEENEMLRKGLEQKTYQLDKMADAHRDCKAVRRDRDEAASRLKHVTAQLEREKAKSKAMSRRIKEAETSNDNNGGDVIWMGANGYHNNNNNNSNSPTRGDEEAGDLASGRGKSRPSSSSERPATTNKRGGEAKQIKSLKAKISSLNGEIKRMKDVSDLFVS